MQPLSTVLRGLQLAIVPEIEAYWLENPVPAHKIKHITPSGWIATVDGQHLNPLHFQPEQPPKPRRRSPKGKASGWIEERTGNKQRITPSVSRYYCHYDSDGKIKRCYLQVHLLKETTAMIDARANVAAVLEFINTHTKRTKL